MDRGHFRMLAAYTLIASMIANPVMAASPGDASRNAVRKQSQRQTSQPALTKLGIIPFSDGSRVEQVVGKQPGKREIDPNRTLFQSNSSNNRTASSGSTQRVSGGLLGNLFGRRGGSSSSSSQNRSGNRTAAPPAETERPPVDWQGIPYHQARSQSTASRNPSPIRDPRPGETTVNPTQKPPQLARLSTTRSGSSAGSGSSGVSKLPTPPSLEPAPSSRRVSSKPAPTKTVSSRLKRDTAPALSALNSSRRSSRRELPQLDASEIAAAKANVVTEEELVPKVSRRRLKPAPTAVAKTQPKPAPAKTPAADVPAKSVEKTKPAIEAVAKTTEPVAKTPSPAPKAIEPKVAAAAPKPAPVAPTPAVQAPALASAPKPVLAAPSQPPVDNFMSSRTQAAPSTMGAIASNPNGASRLPYNTPAQPSGPQFVAPSVPPAPAYAPRMAANMAAPRPAAPQFGAQGNVAGHRLAPPAAFQQRGVAPTPVGSGVAQPYALPRPTAQGYWPEQQLATNPRPAQQTPQAAPLVSPRDPYGQRAPQQFASQNTSPVATLGNPSIEPPLPAPLPAPSPASLPAPAQVPTPKMTVPSPAQTVAAPIEDAFSNTPLGSAGKNSDNHRSSDLRPNGLAPNQSAVASELPGIRVVTHGPSSVIIRQAHEFEIRVENRGSIDASGVMVRAIVPDWAEVRGQRTSKGDVESQMTEKGDRLVWKIDSIPAGTTERLFVRLQALRSGTHGMDVDWTLIPQKSVATIEVREPKLDLLIEGPEEVVYGESQTYKVRVLNPGDGVAPNVVFTLSPNSATPQTQRIGDIPSGKEAQFEVELTAQDLGDLKIHGLAMGELDLKAEANKTIRVAAADLESVLTGPEMKYQDTNAVYHLQVTNHGTATSEDIKASLDLPSGVEYLGGIGTAKLRGNLLTWPILSLAPGATAEFEFECGMKSPGKKAFEFKANGTAAGESMVSLDTQVDSIADLVMTIQDPTAPAPVGTEVTYEITIKNRGSRDAKGVRAIAQFSHGIEPRRIEGHTGQVLTGQVLFDSIDTIDAGGEVRIRVIAEAETSGHHRFRTEIRSGETVLVAEEATHYMSQRSDRVSRRSVSSVR